MTNQPIQCDKYGLVKGPYNNLIGEVYNRLTVVSLAGKLTGNAYSWNCRCVCGNDVVVRGNNLRTGQVKSCGCANDHSWSVTHGLTDSDEYNAWINIKQRCRNNKNDSYPYYGGRGIDICDEWFNSFEKFFSHIGPKPSHDLTVERINNDRGYEPGNVKWATRLEQTRNRRPSIINRHKLENRA